MRRSLNIMLWMLLGAIAAGGSAGFFLWQANQDRQYLIRDAQYARLEADQAKQLSDKAMSEANQKLDQAKEKEAQAKLIVQQYQQQQQLLKSAKPLSKPGALVTKGWSEYVSVPLRLSLKVPTRNQAWDTTNGIAVGSKNTSLNNLTDQWLSIMPFDEQTDTSLKKNFVRHETVVWYIDNHIVTGAKGSFGDASNTAYLLEVMDGTTSTHLLWARTNQTVTEQRLLDTLSTLTFAS